MKRNTFARSVFLALAMWSSARGEFPEIHDSQLDAPPLTTPTDALAAIRMPERFRAELYAAEPDVQQPIGFTIDGRRRVWVAENYTYAERPTQLDLRLRDRIVVLEDTDRDGKADQRNVFFDEFVQLTSVEVGLGGVWALCPPQLLFLPDRDGDAKPDGPPEVVLDGFDIGVANRHNFANGLKWGPDGWLYGRNGITHEGRVGVPGTPLEQRTFIGPGIWRYHPMRKTVEMVCTGTTNPWGHDWDEHGELFFINTVIGHLWHAVPGAHLRRMFGVDRNPFVYELMDQTADHVHWDSREVWQEVRKGVSPTTDQAGGGHAHSGMMIYLGDNWPSSYRGEMLTLNLHGRRLNQDHLERDGASYVAHHGPDSIFFGDPWFRGIDLMLGPAGEVLVSDWSDVGECHEVDGVHRHSGRLYRLIYVGLEAPTRGPDERGDLAGLKGTELLALQTHDNEWWVRQARQELYHRHVRGDDLSAERVDLLKQWRTGSHPRQQLRALWCLLVTGGVSTDDLRHHLQHPDEHVRAWSVRLLMEDKNVSQPVLAELQAMAHRDTSGLVMLYLASGLQRLPVAERGVLAVAMAARQEWAEDRTLPLMIWYGAEPFVVAQPTRAIELATRAASSKLRQFVARRLTHELASHPDGVDRLLVAIADTANADHQADLLNGMNAALRGWRKADPPSKWAEVHERLKQVNDERVRSELRELAVVFGDGRAIEELRQMVEAKTQDPAARRAAIRTLSEIHADGLEEMLFSLLTDHDVAPEAARSLAASANPLAYTRLLENYGQMWLPAREAAIASLSSRREGAEALVQAIELGHVDRAHVQLFQIRQMQQLANEPLQERLAKLWPELRPIDADKRERIGHFKRLLTAERLAAAPRDQGKQVWQRNCANCHTLFGEGGKIGPDLTGAQRGNLDYLLENIIDPSASLVPTFRMSTLTLTDGRVLNGVIMTRTDTTWELQTPTERLTIPVSDIEESRDTGTSLMPTGLLDLLSEEEVTNLIGYLSGAE